MVQTCCQGDFRAGLGRFSTPHEQSGAPRPGSESETLPSGYSDSIEVSSHFFAHLEAVVPLLLFLAFTRIMT